MGLGQYVFPRYAVHIASGQAVPIERLRARCLWYPALSLDGRMVSGHVIYVAQALAEAMELQLGLHGAGDWNAVGEVEGGETDVTYRLATPVRASAHASVPQLIRAIVDHTRQTLPVSKRRMLATLGALDPRDMLWQLEEILQKNRIHVLVPLYIGNQYQLFTDATEALRPVSPQVLKRTPRLCFVLLSTDGLKDERRVSPWLREAAELMALPVNVIRTPEVSRFMDELPALRPASDDEHLMRELLTTLHELTGGWPDLCDRFYDTLTKLPDVPALRQRLWDLAALLRALERDPAAVSDLLELAFAGRANLPDLSHLGGGTPPASHEGLWALVERAVVFTWEEHGRGYLEGLMTWERRMAVPRSRAIELSLRRRLDAMGLSSTSSGALVPARATPSSGSPAAPTSSPMLPASRPHIDPARAHDSATVGENPGPFTVRWLHVSDFHFSDKHQVQGAGVVLESLLSTVAELRQHGRGVDCIFVTGDIAQSGSESEYRLAETFLGRLCEAAGVPRAAVFMVPGNHDVFRPTGLGLQRTLQSYDEAQLFFQPAAKRWHLAKMEAFCAFYDRFYATGHTGSAPPRKCAPGLATAGPEIYRVRSLNLGLLPLNTAWFAQDDQDAGKLFIGEALLRAQLPQIQDAHLHIAFMHHPLSDLSDLERRQIQELLNEHCHFILRGHLHDTEAQRLVGAYKNTMSLAAGAAYQGRVVYQNRALYCEVDVDAEHRIAEVRPYPIRYEMTGHDRWTLDTSVFPKSYPSYLETMRMTL